MSKRRRLKLGFELDQALQRFEKILKRRRRKHDGVTASAYVFGDLQKPTALIFFEVEKENLPFDGNLFGRDRIRSHSLLSWILVAHIQTITDSFAQTKPMAGPKWAPIVNGITSRAIEDSVFLTSAY